MFRQVLVGTIPNRNAGAAADRQLWNGSGTAENLSERGVHQERQRMFVFVVCQVEEIRADGTCVSPFRRVDTGIFPKSPNVHDLGSSVPYAQIRWTQLVWRGLPCKCIALVDIPKPTADRPVRMHRLCGM